MKISRELLEDSINIGDILTGALANALALELDRVALLGSGTAPEPRGIFNTSGILSQSQGDNGAALTGFGPLVTMSDVPRDVARGGLHEVAGNPIYVSAGVGMERGSAPQVRLFCPPEIGVVTLR